MNEQYADIQASIKTKALECPERSAPPPDSASFITNTELWDQVSRFAEAMTKADASIPTYLADNVGDCIAITMQSIEWRMNPFLVAQKTQLINGVLAYEDELINAIVNNCAPTTTRLQIEWVGDWDNIIGRVKAAESKTVDGDIDTDTVETYIKCWTDEEEKGLSVKVWATIIGEEKPRELTLGMTQVVTKNSQLWVEDPREHIAHLAIKRWARMHCPEVIIGIYTPEEIRARKAMSASPKPEDKMLAEAKARLAAETFVEKSKDRLENSQAMASMVYDLDRIIKNIENADNNKTLEAIGKTIKSMMDNPSISLEAGSEDHKALRVAYELQKNKIEAAQISINITSAKTTSQLDSIEEVINGKASDYKPELIAQLQSELINARRRIIV